MCHYVSELHGIFAHPFLYTGGLTPLYPKLSHPYVYNHCPKLHDSPPLRVRKVPLFSDYITYRRDSCSVAHLFSKALRGITLHYQSCTFLPQLHSICTARVTPLYLKTSYSFMRIAC